MENAEVWKDIKGYEGLYQISNYGNIWSIRKQRKLNPTITKLGYPRICLVAKNGKKKYEFVHRLVAIMFIENPNHYPIVNHKDRNPGNPHADNLEWCSYKYNIEYEGAHQRTAEANKKAINQYTANGVYVASFNSGVEAEQITGISRQNISSCLHGRRTLAGGYSWQFNNKET